MQYFLAANLKLVIQHQSYQGQFIHGLLIDELLLFFPFFVFLILLRLHYICLTLFGTGLKRRKNGQL
mgnify:CR=1 FL=1